MSGARLRALLAQLALRAGQAVPSSQLIDALWDGDAPMGSANALQALVSRLRRALPDGVVESNQHGYRLAVVPDAVDAVRFERLVSDGRAEMPHDPHRAAAVLHEALELWRGEALADIPPVRFVQAEAARLAELKAAALEDLSEAELAVGTGPPDVAGLEALVAQQPTRERAVGLLMRALCTAGRPADALAAYERLRATLTDQLGAAPSPELAALHLKILRGEAEAPRSDPPARRQTNLRSALTSFVGRDEDLIRVSKLVADSRFVSLTGPGGSGKTRLAVETGWNLVDQMPDGVWFAELAPLTEPDELPQTILGALGLRDQAVLPQARNVIPGLTVWNDTLDDLAEHLGSGSASLGRLVRSLAGKRLLLILDNCEHLVDAVAAVTERLLGECAELRVLVTSREPLGVTGEVLWPVEPLLLSPADAGVQDALAFAAVRLFADRAAAVHPSFVVDDDTVADVVRICRALDGIPLAIELAAARLRTMTSTQVADRLDDRFGLLASGSRTGHQRHRTLRAVVDWSWDLLEEHEQRLLRRLAYFSGSVTADGVARMAAIDGDRAGDVLDTLTTLVDKSLLLLDRSGEPRYRLLETIKAYGLERLADSGETEAARQAHAAYVLELVEHAERYLRTGAQLYWLDRLDEEYEDVVAALRGAIAEGDALMAVRLVAGLGYYWNLRAKRVEGVEFVSAALAVPGEVPDEIRALAYSNGWICGAWVLGEERAAEWMRTATELAGQFQDRHPMLRLVGPASDMVRAWVDGITWTVPDEIVADPHPWVRGLALIMRAYSHLHAGMRHDQALMDVQQALGAFRESGDRAGIAMALQALADLMAQQGDFDAAVTHAEEALQLAIRLKSAEDVAQLRVSAARYRWLLGDRERARVDLAAAERETSRVGLIDVRTTMAATAAQLARLDGDLAEARTRIEQAEATVGDLGPDTDCRVLVLLGRGYLDTREGALERARGRFGEALRQALAFGDASLIAPVMVGVADLAQAMDRPVEAAQLLGASVAIRGVPDASLVDASRVTDAARGTLGERWFAEAYGRGLRIGGAPAATELAAVILDA